MTIRNFDNSFKSAVKGISRPGEATAFSRYLVIAFSPVFNFFKNKFKFLYF